LNLCACIGVMTFVMMVLHFVVVTAFSMRMYMNYQHCFHSKEHVFKENVIAHKGVNRIHFDVVTGYVNVRVHSGSNIEIRVWDKVRSLSLVDNKTFESGVVLNHSTVYVKSITPAFNCRTCQHTAVEIFIPKSYPQAIAISGLVKVGYVNIISDISKNLGDVDVIVELGYIRARNLLSSSISLTTEVGAINVHNAIVQNVKLQVHTGSIETDELLTHNFHSVIQYGCTRHFELKGDKVKVDTKFGYSKVYEPSTLGKELDLTVNTEYGHSLVLLEFDQVNFNIGNSKGHMMIEYEDEDWTCKVEKNASPVLMHGNCTVKNIKTLSENQKTSVKVNMNTKYGTADLAVDHFVEDEDM